MQRFIIQDTYNSDLKWEIMSSNEDYDSSSSDVDEIRCDHRFYEVDSPDFIPWWQDYLEYQAENFG